MGKVTPAVFRALSNILLTFGHCHRHMLGACFVVLLLQLGSGSGLSIGPEWWVQCSTHSTWRNER